MTIDPEKLAAYADGELDAAQAAEVEAAIAADPALADQVVAHRVLRARLSEHFAPIIDMPVPERLTQALRPSAEVVDIAAARHARGGAPPGRLRWMMGGALAASLALGLILGSQLPRGGSIVSRDGQLIASGALDKALTSQLASAPQGGGVRILLSFRDTAGRYCRGFEQGGSAGIACHNGTIWAIERMQAAAPEPGTKSEYRQAGSAVADIMEASQNMALDGALDGDSERKARDAGWRR